MDNTASLDYHHMLMMLIAASWIASALLLAGCTSNASGIDDIYLLSVKYNNHSGSHAQAASLFGNASVGGQVTVRAGYLGLCAKNGDEGAWICASGVSGLGMNLASGSSGSHSDPLDAIGWAAHFKNDVVFSGLLFAAMALTALAFLGLASFPGWHDEHDSRIGIYMTKQFPSKPVMLVCMFCLCVASLLLLTSALWQHVAAATAARMISSGTQGYVTGNAGPAAAVLVWLAFTFVVVAATGILIMIMSIYLLDRLTDS